MLIDPVFPVIRGICHHPKLFFDLRVSAFGLPPLDPERGSGRRNQQRVCAKMQADQQRGIFGHPPKRFMRRHDPADSRQKIQTHDFQRSWHIGTRIRRPGTFVKGISVLQPADVKTSQVLETCEV